MPASPPTVLETRTARWAIQASYEAYGVRFGLRASHADALDRFDPFLPPGCRPARLGEGDRVYSLVAEAPAHRLYRGPRLLGTDPDWAGVHDRLESDLQIHVGEMAPERVFVHAGVIAWKGVGIMIPGRSCSGKSTLVACLLRAGATYYSDEFAVIDAGGVVHPYPRLLSIRRGVGERTLRVDAAHYGAPTAASPMRLGLVLMTRYRPGKRWYGEAVTRGGSLLELARHCLPIRRRPADSLEYLAYAIAGAVVLGGPRGEVEETLGRLTPLVRQIAERSAPLGSGDG